MLRPPHNECVGKVLCFSRSVLLCLDLKSQSCLCPSSSVCLSSIVSCPLLAIVEICLPCLLASCALHSSVQFHCETARGHRKAPVMSDLPCLLNCYLATTPARSHFYRPYNDVKALRLQAAGRCSNYHKAAMLTVEAPLRCNARDHRR